MVQDKLHVLIEKQKEDVRYDYEHIVVDVPKHKPLTDEQFKLSNSIWPCYYQIVNEKLPYFDPDIANRLKFLDGICSGHAIFVDKLRNIVYEKFDNNTMFGHAIFTGIEKISRKTEGYLCNKLDLYIASEPCISCAVALIHARIDNVFVLKCRNKGVYTDLKLNYTKNVNHKYNAYQINS